MVLANFRCWGGLIWIIIGKGHRDCSRCEIGEGGIHQIPLKGGHIQIITRDKSICQQRVKMLIFIYKIVFESMVMQDVVYTRRSPTSSEGKALTF